MFISPTVDELYLFSLYDIRVRVQLTSIMFLASCPTIISRLGNGEFSWRAPTRVGRLKCTVSHLDSNTRREILKRPNGRARCRPGMYGNVTLPPPSFIVLHGDWRRGSLLDIWTVGLSAHVTYVFAAIARSRVCALANRACVWKDR